MEGVQVGALEEFRGEFSGVKGDAFHPPSMGGCLVPGGGVMSCRGGVRDVKGGKRRVNGIRIFGFDSGSFYLMNTETVIRSRI